MSSSASSSESSSSSDSSSACSYQLDGRVFPESSENFEDYDQFVNIKVEQFYEDNPNIFENKTDEEKEEIIIELVGDGKLIIDIAIEIAKIEKLDI